MDKPDDKPMGSLQAEFRAELAPLLVDSGFPNLVERGIKWEKSLIDFEWGTPTSNATGSDD